MFVFESGRKACPNILEGESSGVVGAVRRVKLDSPCLDDEL